MNLDDDDIVTNASPNPHLGDLVPIDSAKRRSLLGGLKVAALSIAGSSGLIACGSGGATESSVAVSNDGLDAVGAARANGAAATVLKFNPVPRSLADTVTLPAGYTYDVVFRLGDPIDTSTAEYKNDGTDAPESFEHRAGDHHDGMYFFGLDADGKPSIEATERGLLAINHEAITPTLLHPRGQSTSGSGAEQIRTSADEVLAEMYIHGVSIIEVQKSGSGWRYKKDSPFNRRINTLSEIEIRGPACGVPAMVTAFSRDGTRTRGTLNNCANGYTPWGTYLTCEENWFGYFRRIAATDDPRRSAKEITALARYGVAGTGRELWATVAGGDDRFTRWQSEVTGASEDGSDDFRNAANTYGWVVEIDPYDPSSKATKRTAMGRFVHEGAWPGVVEAGKPIVYYMGCDSRNEYIYKYVSTANWDPVDIGEGLVAGEKYLDDGRLYVAKFAADGTGQWLELAFGVDTITPDNSTYAFADPADVLINARLAADARGATKMDRPEWGAVNPVNGEVYMTLTNNSRRTVSALDAANPRFYSDDKAGTAQTGNVNGHIVRWREAGGDGAATSFQWDIFLFGAEAGADPANVNVSGLTAANDLSSPDGLWFSQTARGLLWIQTDDGAYTDVTNCMLLAAIPGEVGDGSPKSIASTDGTTSRSVETFVGKPLGDSALRRFLVGPKECEITGITETPDGRTLFVNIQHPGEDTRPDYDARSYGSNWPDGGTARPRSATIAIRREDGGVIAV